MEIFCRLLTNFSQNITTFVIPGKFKIHKICSVGSTHDGRWSSRAARRRRARRRTAPCRARACCVSRAYCVLRAACSVYDVSRRTAAVYWRGGSEPSARLPLPPLLPRRIKHFYFFVRIRFFSALSEFFSRSLAAIISIT